MSELEALRDAVARVRAIHAPEVLGVHEGYGEEVWCPTCEHHYPCPTIAALDGAPEPEWEYGSAHRDDPSVGATEYSKERAEQRVREWNDHDDQKSGLLVRRRPAGPWLPVEGESK